MNIILTGRQTLRSRLAAFQAQWSVADLKLESSRCSLEIIPVKGLRELHGCNALAGKSGSLIGLAFDTSLPTSQLITSIAHEMIHVKQLARGTLVFSMKRGKEIAIWRGKKVDVPYLERPWEIEAYGKQEILARRFNEFVSNFAEGLKL